MDIDAALIARLESSSARLSADVAAAMAAVSSGTMHVPAAEPMHGGFLIGLGPGRYVNRAVGLAAADVTSDDVDEIERFFAQRDLDPMIEVCSWSSPSLLDELAARRYRPLWFRNVYARPPMPPAASTTSAAVDPSITIVVVDGDLFGTWCEVLALGNGVDDPAGRATSDEFAATRVGAGSQNFLALVDGRPVGCGSLEVCAGIGWVGGAATMPEARGRGVQSALLRYRLALAADIGCDLVAATALPTGASARNLARNGFDLTHVQIVMSRPVDSIRPPEDSLL